MDPVASTIAGSFSGAQNASNRAARAGRERRDGADAQPADRYDPGNAAPTEETHPEAENQHRIDHSLAKPKHHENPTEPDRPDAVDESGGLIDLRG